MLLRRSLSSAAHGSTQFEVNSRQCSCCLVIPHRLWPVVVGQRISHLCDRCYASYNSGHTVVPRHDGTK